MIEQIGAMLQFLVGHAQYLVLFALCFVAIETMWPAVPTQSRWRSGTSTDLLLSFGNPLVVQPLNDFLVALILTRLFALTDPHWLANAQGFWESRSFWVQFLAALVVADLAAYWKHRVFHMRFLWPFHAVHHSATAVDWLTNDRDHPVQLLGTYLVLTLVMVLAGFSPEMIALQSFWRRCYSLYTHANVHWSYGPLNRVFVSPAFHRWHHANDAQMIGRNFAVVFSFFDVLFGTYRLPHTPPVAFGLADRDNPQTFLAVLSHPLVYVK